MYVNYMESFLVAAHGVTKLLPHVRRKMELDHHASNKLAMGHDRFCDIPFSAFYVHLDKHRLAIEIGHDVAKSTIPIAGVGRYIQGYVLGLAAKKLAITCL